MKKNSKQSQHELFKQTAKDQNCDEKLDLKKLLKKSQNLKKRNDF